MMKRASELYRRTAAVAGTALLLALPNMAVAQAPPTAVAPAADAAEAVSGPAALAEELTVLRAVKPLQLTPEQLQALSGAVAAGRERLAKQMQTDVKALAALREPIERARQQLFTRRVDANDPQAAALVADQPVDAARRAGQQGQQRVQDELTASIQRQLSTLLTPAQLEAIAAQGRSMVAAERLAQDQQREQFRQQMQQGAAQRAGVASGMPPGAAQPGRGGRGGGPGGRGGPDRMLERLRGADADEYQRMTRGIARRFGDEGTPAYQNALSMFDRIRSMPDAQFRRQRGSLTRQFDAAMNTPRSASSAAASVSVENATETWVRRFLLSPQAPAALKDLAAPNGAG
jgi:hypothetical protein